MYTHPSSIVFFSSHISFSVIRKHADGSVSLAGREVQRYAYQRTGSLLPIVTNTPSCCMFAIDLGTDSPFWTALNVSGSDLETMWALQAQEHALLTQLNTPTCPTTLLAGGDSAAVLYAAYAWAEAVGVRFMLHEDVLPDQLVSYQYVCVCYVLYRAHTNTYTYTCIHTVSRSKRSSYNSFCFFLRFLVVVFLSSILLIQVWKNYSDGLDGRSCVAIVILTAVYHSRHSPLP